MTIETIMQSLQCSPEHPFALKRAFFGITNDIAFSHYCKVTRKIAHWSLRLTFTIFPILIKRRDMTARRRDRYIRGLAIPGHNPQNSLGRQTRQLSVFCLTHCPD